MAKKQTPQDPDDDDIAAAGKRDLITKTLVEGRKMEAFAEHRTKDMKCCALCGNICYRKTPVKTIGKTDICIECMRALKEALDTVDQWSEQVSLEHDVRKKMDDGFGV